MVLSKTRNQDIQNLTATNGKQSVVLASSYSKIRIRVTTTGVIRIGINGNPETLTDLTGISISDTRELQIEDHVIQSIDYIRDNAETSDITFDLIGMW